jgi:hypothetical protein
MRTDAERDAVEQAFALKQSFYEARGYSRAAATERAWSSLMYDMKANFDWGSK